MSSKQPMRSAICLRTTDESKSSTAVPATLHFSAFRGYYIVPNKGGPEIEVPTERVGRGGGMGKGLQAGDRVMFDSVARADQPLVTSFVAPAPVAARKAPVAAPKETVLALDGT